MAGQLFLGGMALALMLGVAVMAVRQGPFMVELPSAGGFADCTARPPLPERGAGARSEHPDVRGSQSHDHQFAAPH